MHSRRSAALTLTLTFMLFALAAPAVRAGTCAEWTAGAFDNGTAVNGADHTVYESFSWDRDGAGPEGPSLVIGGQFSSVEGVAASRIALRSATTGNWEPLGTGLDGNAYAFAVYGGDLYVAGDFAHAGGVVANNIARWDGSAWHALQSGTGGTVACMMVFEGELIVGGLFGSADGTPALHIAAWNGDSWREYGNGVIGDVNCLGTYAGDLIAGGSVTNAGGVPVQRIARWTGSTWQALSSGMNGAVLGLTLFNGELIAAGQFTTAGGVAASRIARWNGSVWQPFGAGVDNSINAVAVYNGLLYAGGYFLNAGGQQAFRLARWNGASWAGVGTGFQAGIHGLHVHQSELIVSGEFTSMGGTVLNRVCRLDPGGIGSFGGGTAANVRAMTTLGSRLVLGGVFHQSTAGALAHNLAAWNGARLTPFGTGVLGTVQALKGFKYSGVFGGFELLVGGVFQSAGGVSASNVARYSEPATGVTPPGWSAMGPGFNGSVMAFERFGNATYAGGSFTTSGGATVNRIARWNETTELWEPLGTGMNGTVNTLRVYGGFLYAGGSFTTAGGVATGGLARWSGSAWSQVGGTFVGAVNALEVLGSDLIVAGLYPGIGGSPNIARFNGTSYSTLGTGGTNAVVRALAVVGGQLYAGGDFSAAGGVSASRLARWSGSAWSAVEGGVPAPISALLSYNGETHAGGDFTTVGSGALASPRWGRFLTTGVPWIAVHPTSRTTDPGLDVAFVVEPGAGYPSLEYQWFKDGVALADGPSGTGSTRGGTSTPTLELQVVGAADQGGYTVAVSNACGADTSFAATLTVNATVDAPLPGNPTATLFESIGPNPTGADASLRFALAREAQVAVRVHDVSGRLVREIDAGRLPAGRHLAIWDARARDGQRVRAGIYLVGLEVDGRRLATKRLAIVR